MSKVLTRTSGAVVKSVSVLTMAATVLSLSGFAVLAPLGAYAAVPSDYGLKEGDTISASGSSDPDVYIVNAQGYKRLFLNPVIFNFYGHLGGFAKVKTVSAVARDAFPTSGLFRNCETDDQKVYGVETTGEDTGMLHWVNTSGAQAVADDPNFFKKVFCINNNEFNWYSKGSNYTSVNQVPNYVRGGSGSTQPPAGSLSVGLAPNNPVAGSIVASQALAHLAYFRVTNNSGASVKVTKVTLKRLGVSGDTTLDKVYLFDSTPKRLSDSGSVSSGNVSFNDPNGYFTVPAGGYFDLWVRSDILTGTQGQTVGVQLTGLNTDTFSVFGNLFTVATAPSDLASFTPGTVTPSDTTIDPQKDYNVWQATWTVGNKDVLLSRFQVRDIGTANYADINNLRLYVDGVQVAQVQNLDANGYVNFVPSAPYRLLTGGRVVKVLADIIGGTNRNARFSVRGKYDIGVIDTNYNVNINPAGTYPLQAGTLTINAGSVTISKDVSSPSGNVIKGASDVVMGKWLVTAYGEPVKLDTLGVEVTYSNGSVGSLRNGRLLANGVQYGSTTTLTTATTPGASTSYTVNLTVNPGTPVLLELRADMFDNAGSDDTTSGDTFTARVAGSPALTNGQGQLSSTLIAVPSADVAANQMTLKTGVISLAKYTQYGDQSITVPKTNFKIADFVLTGSSDEDTNVSNIQADFTGTSNFVVGKLSNVYVKYGGTSSTIKSTVAATGNTWSPNFVLTKGTSIHVEVWADISSFTTGTMTTKVLVSGTTAASATAVNTNSNAVLAGQVMTQANGTVASALGGLTPVARMAAANSTTDAAQFTFTGTNDSFTLTDVTVGFPYASASVFAAGTISNVLLKRANGSVVSTQPMVRQASGSFYAVFTGLTEPIPANVTDGLVLTAALQLGGVGIGMGTTSANDALTLTSWKANSSAGVQQAGSAQDTDRVGNALYVHANYPQVSAVALPSTLLAAGEQSLSKFTLTGVGGTAGFKKVIFSITKTSGASITSSSYKIFEDGVDISSAATLTETNTAPTNKTMTVVFTSERQFGTSGRTYELKATLGGTLSAGESLSTRLAQPSSNATPNNYAVVALTSASLVWTDRSSSAHGEGTADWMNDNLVQNLPISQSLSK